VSRSATLTLQPTLPLIADNNRLRLFSGSANVPLSQEVARYLGMDLGPMVRKRFADGELYIQIQESIRGCDVYLFNQLASR
jgi:ribose-phosphate pyrophosphokinase